MKTGWKDLPIGGVILESGSAEKYPTGGWRSRKPIIDLEKCSSCLICWIYCPDSSIIVEDGKTMGINYNFCKGCGICAKVCPPKIKAIEMVDEKGL
jgi:pyruvate ferredoxin oxidoreductase delta subunit